MQKNTIFIVIFILLFGKTISFAQTPSAISLPEIPSVPKPIDVITKDSRGKALKTQNIEELFKEEEIQFSDRKAPPKFKLDLRPQTEIGKPGEISDGKVSAYLHLPLMDSKTAIAKLKEAGFKILATFKVDRKGVATSIVFTNDAIEKSASQEMRGFASTLRLTLDKKNKITSISNPIYLMRSFMQNQYNEELATNTLEQLRNVFPDFENSEEMIKYRVLENFHFMENMPYYQDMKVIAKGDNKSLLKRAQKSKQVVYTQELSNGAIVIGVKLGKRTTKFVKKIGYTNAGLLPYPVLIENGRAKILAPQYYIALMYPLLKMSKFMKIATVPGAIAKDVDKIFR